MKEVRQQVRVETIKSFEQPQAEKVVFNWVKTGVITVKQFRELMRVVLLGD